MDKKNKDRAQIILHPALIFILVTSIGYILEILVPWKIFFIDLNSRFILSIFFYVFFFVITSYGFIAFRYYKTPVDPFESSIRLVTTGIFRFSRNPMYIALISLPVSFGLMLNTLWIIIQAPILSLLIHFFVVLPEEKYLLKKFGVEYDAYRKRVRRWL